MVNSKLLVSCLMSLSSAAAPSVFSNDERDLAIRCRSKDVFDGGYSIRGYETNQRDQYVVKIVEYVGYDKELFNGVASVSLSPKSEGSSECQFTLTGVDQKTGKESQIVMIENGEDRLTKLDGVKVVGDIYSEEATSASFFSRLNCGVSKKFLERHAGKCGKPLPASGGDEDASAAFRD